MRRLIILFIFHTICSAVYLVAVQAYAGADTTAITHKTTPIETAGADIKQAVHAVHTAEKHHLQARHVPQMKWEYEKEAGQSKVVLGDQQTQERKSIRGTCVCVCVCACVGDNKGDHGKGFRFDGQVRFATCRFIIASG